MIQQLLEPNLSTEEEAKIQEQLLTASEKSLSPDQRQYLKNELRRHRASMERSSIQRSRQEKDMSPLRQFAAALPPGILTDEPHDKGREEFVLHM